MLKSLMQGITTGTGMGIGQEIASTLIQTVVNKKLGGNMGGGANLTDMDIRCGKCNELNTTDSRFCGGCGNSLVRKIQLSSGATCTCGFVNCSSQRFCSECGTRLNA